MQGTVHVHTQDSPNKTAGQSVTVVSYFFLLHILLMTFDSTEGSWDGRLNGIAVPVGTYYYHIRVDEPAMQAEWTGPITLMR